MTRHAPGTALSREQWDRRPVAQRGQTPRPEQERKATDNPNRDVVGCDHLRWFADGLVLQQEFSAKSPGLELNCNAAIVVVSESGWDTFMKAYSSGSA